MASVSKRLGVSTNTVSRDFNLVQYTCNQLPTVLSIDKFKGNSSHTKYHCALVNPVTHQVLDIIKERHLPSLFSYFKLFERRHVTHIVCDMY